MIISRLIAGLLLLILFGCSTEKVDNQLEISMRFNQKIVSCSSELSLGDKVWRIGQVQFFIANVEAQDAKGRWQTILLKSMATQSSTLALVGQNCAEKDKANWQLTFEPDVKLSQFQRLRFQLGVPFELNHLNPLTQTSPLNVSSMFWVWQTGHKFARIEMQSASDNWIFHLGSTGCLSPSVMRAPSEPCRYPNLYSFELALDNHDQLVFDLAKLLDKVELGQQAHCQSEHDNPNCRRLFNNLSHVSGQSVFRMATSE
ncbi:hypothetical protein tinsulaeT_10490 [Thalassotalea insulae]|uniref:Copper-binding protein MbnP-like domain-containing protein n=1 Tax=Thalassotalea insulae TaxID=2056778 RepID=A0ABQ6GR94_9GAMM|nr:MbnP family copper-binding protein [Thalassotalea insulae]GLX77709.1 hypothetical protein tinsulaeT_10490 [Thalassotalea insulae]